MDKLTNVDRPSISEPLEDLYRKKVSNNANEASSTEFGNIRSQVKIPRTGLQNWDLSSQAGVPSFNKVNAFGNQYQTEFEPNALPQVTRYTDAGLEYADRVLKIDRTPYGK